jgi:serine/threonine protein phosphatase PrpC
MTQSTKPGEHPSQVANFEVAALSDVGTNRDNNEDSCGHYIESQDRVLFAVADGLGGYGGGEVASAMAIDITLSGFCENPVAWGAAKRLLRATQRANIEIHNRALAVPELRRMATTLTAVVVDEGILHATHVGDCRLYLLRRGRIQQITKDHTVVADRVRMGLLSAARARTHPERSTLNRSMGQDLIVSVDRITLPLLQNDRLILCSDGLYNVLEPHDIAGQAQDSDAETGCRRLLELANKRGTADNLTASVFIMKGPTNARAVRSSWLDRIGGFFSRGRQQI